MCCKLAFTLFGSFWLSYAAILIPGSGILASYPTERAHSGFSSQRGSALPSSLAALHKSTIFIALFAFLGCAFFLLGWASSPRCRGAVTQAGGALDIVTALIAYSIAFTVLRTADRAPALP
ncbi:hypothetical protein B0H10DRAFT_2222953 [Mycena sp. CBHHK59/15]|nr:hypothetical protein B0H10DRAFT_2222953 [Mycena sp. CBHHK59/15]